MHTVNVRKLYVGTCSTIHVFVQVDSPFIVKEIQAGGAHVGLFFSDI